MKEFIEVFNKLQQSETFKEVTEHHNDLKLAHGFTQLNAQGAQAKPWQIGLYSKEEDKLAVFETGPIKFVGLEEAFKKGGEVAELKDTDKFISSQQAIETVQKEMEVKYAHEMPTSYLVIVQQVKENPVYNITVITAAFAMLTFHVHAIENNIIKEGKQSIMDLKKPD